MVSKKGKFNILFIDSLFNRYYDVFPGIDFLYYPNSPGVAFLRSYLETRGIQTTLINLNKKVKGEEKRQMMDALFRKRVDFQGYENLFFKIMSSQYINSFASKLLSTNNWEELEELNIFKEAFKNISKEDLKSDFLGVSVHIDSQVVPAIVLAIFIKLVLKSDIKIVFGGPLVTLGYNDFLRILQIHPIIDYLVIGEGETPLYLLLKGEKKESIPNLVYRENSEYRFSSNMHGFEKDLNELPAPIYEKGDFPFVQASRGCSWGKCNFCIHFKRHSSNPVYRQKSPERIMQDVLNIKAINNKNFYRFVDNELNYHFLNNFSKKINVNNLIETKFSSFLRIEECFDYKTIELAKRAGFERFDIGVESFVPRLRNNVLNKGVSQEKILQIIDDCSRLGIELIIQIMIGIPTQTKEELLDDCQQILHLARKYKDSQIIFSAQALRIESDSLFCQEPKKFGIELLTSERKFFSSIIPFVQTSKNCISTKEAINIYNSFVAKHQDPSIHFCS